MRGWVTRFRVVLQVAVALLFVFPVYWILVTATNLPGHVYQIPPTLLPHFDLQPLVAAWGSFPWARYLANSGGMTAFTIVFVVVTSALAGLVRDDERTRAEFFAIVGRRP